MRGGLASDDSYILFMMTKPGQPSSRASPHSAYLARKDPPHPRTSPILSFIPRPDQDIKSLASCQLARPHTPGIFNLRRPKDQATRRAPEMHTEA